MPGSSSLLNEPFVGLYPEELNFFHQFGSSTPPPAQNVQISFNNASQPVFEFQITYLSGNGWINIGNLDINLNAPISVNTAGFNPGNYVAEIRVKMLDDQGNILATSDPSIVRLAIDDADFLSVSPTTLNFSHSLGSSLPPSQFLQLDSSLSWYATIDLAFHPDVLLMNPISGSDGSGQSIEVSLKSEIDNQSIGQLEIPVIFTAGAISVTVNVIINIDQPIGGFNVSPAVINIEWMRGSALPNSSEIHLFSDDEWVVDSKPSWLHLSQLSGLTSAVLFADVLNLNSFSAGDYQGNIVFNYQGNLFSIEVHLSVWNFLETDFVNGNVYFTRNDEILKFHSNRPDTYIEIKVNAVIFDFFGESKTFLKIFKLPLFQQKNDFHLGKIIDQLVSAVNRKYDGINQPSQLVYFHNFHKIDVEITEYDYEGNAYFSANFYSLFFLKGRKKTTDKILMDGGKRGRIFNVYGKVESQILFYLFNSGFHDMQYFGLDTSLTRPVYGTKLLGEVRFLENVPGIINNRKINLTYAGQDGIQKYYILMPEFENLTKITFINSFNLPEEIYFSGKFQKENRPEIKMNPQHDFLYQRNENVFISNKSVFKINTGKIFQTELPAIYSILKSPFVWVDLDPGTFQARCLTKKIITKREDEGMVSVDLEFEIIENTNDTVY